MQPCLWSGLFFWLHWSHKGSHMEHNDITVLRKHSIWLCDGRTKGKQPIECVGSASCITHMSDPIQSHHWLLPRCISKHLSHFRLKPQIIAGRGSFNADQMSLKIVLSYLTQLYSLEVVLICQSLLSLIAIVLQIHFLKSRDGSWVGLKSLPPAWILAGALLTHPEQWLKSFWLKSRDFCEAGTPGQGPKGAAGEQGQKRLHESGDRSSK